jgi:hypothetical protein
MKEKEYFKTAAAMANAESIMNDNSESAKRIYTKRKKDPKLPKGCKHYNFIKRIFY